MALDDPFFIQQAKDTHESEVEVLYWILEDALYANKFARAESIYLMLLYLAQYRKDLLTSGLRPAQRDRLQQIAYELHSSESIQKRSTIAIKPGTSMRGLHFKREKQLQDFLYLNPRILGAALGDRVKMMGQEVETDFEYRCDLVAESSSSFYPIELKIGGATHAVVSQIQKYCFYFYRKLRYGMYLEIKGVVIASSFDDWSINELRRDGVLLFQVSSTKDSDVSLTAIG